VPPAPACISIYASKLSVSFDKKHLISFFLTFLISAFILFTDSSITDLLFSSNARLYSSNKSLLSCIYKLKELIKSS